MRQSTIDCWILVCKTRSGPDTVRRPEQRRMYGNSICTSPPTQDQGHSVHVCPAPPRHSIFHGSITKGNLGSTTNPLSAGRNQDPFLYEEHAIQSSPDHGRSNRYVGVAKVYCAARMVAETDRCEARRTPGYICHDGTNKNAATNMVYPWRAGFSCELRHGEGSSMLIEQVPLVCSTTFVEKMRTVLPRVPVLFSKKAGEHAFEASLTMKEAWIAEGCEFLLSFW